MAGLNGTYSFEIVLSCAKGATYQDCPAQMPLQPPTSAPLKLTIQGAPGCTGAKRPVLSKISVPTIALLVASNRAGGAVDLTLRNLVFDGKGLSQPVDMFGSGAPWALSVSDVDFRNGAKTCAARQRASEGGGETYHAACNATAPTPPRRCVSAYNLGSLTIERSNFLKCGNTGPKAGETNSGGGLYYGFSPRMASGLVGLPRLINVTISGAVAKRYCAGAYILVEHQVRLRRRARARVLVWCRWGCGSLGPLRLNRTSIDATRARLYLPCAPD